MRAKFLHIYQLITAGFDIFSINILFIIAFFIFKSNGWAEKQAQYSYFLLLMNIVWIITVLNTDLYNKYVISSFEKFSKNTLRSYMLFLLPVVILLFFFRMLLLSRIFITIILIAIPIVLFINRLIYVSIFLYLQKGNEYINKVLIIGYNNLSKKITTLLEEDGIDKQIVGYCEEYNNVNELSNYPILSSIKNTMLVCEQYGVTEIYSTIAPEHNSIVYNLMQQADESCIRFKIVPDLGIFTKKQMHIDQLRGMPVISMRKEPLQMAGNQFKKRLFDIVLSSLAIIFILSWLMPLLSLIIWFENKGSIFFVQDRTGKDNKIFRCIKFRSMRVSNEANSKQATRNDTRITKIGAFMRRNNLDEFPQFFNVLAGHMSIVGPRPHMVKHTDEYSKSVDKYMVRQFLKPGITGWAQVNGLRGETQTLLQMENRVEHDLWYLENWSLWLDVKIIFMTVFNSVTGDKNAF